MKLSQTKSLFIFLNTVLVINLFAKPDVTIKTEYYNVSGSSAKEIRRNMNKQRFKYTSANYDAKTKSKKRE